MSKEAEKKAEDKTEKEAAHSNETKEETPVEDDVFIMAEIPQKLQYVLLLHIFSTCDLMGQQ